jgi:hypothetical protein
MSKELKDFEVVAHVIKFDQSDERKIEFQGEYRLLAIYINRYGIEVGMLVECEEGHVHSWGSEIYEEFLAFQHQEGA